MCAILTVVALLSTGVLAAGDRHNAVAQRARKWRSLPPEKQRELRKRWNQFKALPAEKRQELRKRAESLREMPKEEIENLRKRKNRFMKLDKQVRQTLRRKHELWRKLRKHLLQELPKEERKRINSLPVRQRNAAVRRLFGKHRRACIEKFFRRLPKEEQARLKQLPEKERNKKLHSMFREQMRRREGEKRHKPGESPPKGRQEPDGNLKKPHQKKHKMGDRLKALRNKVLRAFEKVPRERKREVIEHLHRAIREKKLPAQAKLPPGLSKEDLQLLRSLTPEQLKRVLAPPKPGPKSPKRGPRPPRIKKTS